MSTKPATTSSKASPSAPQPAAKEFEIFFSLPADRETDSLELYGSWDSWTKGTILQKKDGTFYAKLRLREGTYSYKYKSANGWRFDKNVQTVNDGFGGFNNLIVISKDGKYDNEKLKREIEQDRHAVEARLRELEQREKYVEQREKDVDAKHSKDLKSLSGSASIKQPVGQRTAVKH